MVKPLNMTNPWEAHAYVALVFRCEDCQTYHTIDSPHAECTDDWCVQLARSAFDSGWFIPHPLHDGSLDTMTSWCPTCGQKRLLTQPCYEGFATPTT